ncbi:MAG: MarR family transcriptional regulator [Symploca sp. SIO2G7]|nr:MarR family transcriptional regulator [Symploca sp. SIO2G7]
MTHSTIGRQKPSKVRVSSAEASTLPIAVQITATLDQPIETQAVSRHYQDTADSIHYRMTKDEWLLAWDELKPAEIKVLYYLRSVDPWGDKARGISVTELAKTLKYNKGTVSRALKKLDHTGWISLEIETATIKLNTKDSTHDLELSLDNDVASRSQALPTDNSADRQTTQQIARQHLAPETQTAQDSQNALNSLKLNKLTTHIEPECGVVSVFKDQEVNPDVSIPDRPVAFPKKSGPVHKPMPIEKELITPPILQPAKKLGVNITDRPLLEMVKQWPERVEDAIAALEEKANRVQSPTRFLVRAIKDGWQPETPRKTSTPGFGQWFREGRSRYLMVASQRVDGILKVLMACDEWVPYDLLQTLSWDEIAARFGGPKQECYAS